MASVYTILKRHDPGIQYERPMLRQKWQWYLLTMLRQTVKSSEVKRLVDVCYTRYREGFVTNGQRGDVPSRYQSLATYRAT
jgi:hypothetical protein